MANELHCFCNARRHNMFEDVLQLLLLIGFLRGFPSLFMQFSPGRSPSCGNNSAIARLIFQMTYQSHLSQFHEKVREAARNARTGREELMLTLFDKKQFKLTRNCFSCFQVHLREEGIREQTPFKSVVVNISRTKACVN
jgi:hypothetical protein